MTILLLRSFGCILYELIELKRAYDQQNEHEIMKAILKSPIPVINSINSDDEDFDKILEKFEIE